MTRRPTLRALVRNGLAATAATALLALGLPGIAPASADTDPLPGVAQTASAVGLPTWQINGVGWAQVVVGNTVYVAGSFSTARPPGVAAGGAGEIAANNIFAYDIRTGNRVASFSHQLNGQALAIAASPDGSRVYVGGDFTTVDGVARAHIAGFDVATGALLPNFAPVLDGQVRAIAATNTTVYAGGPFAHVGDVFRQNFAAFTVATGALLPWAPKNDGQTIRAMVLTPDQSKVVLGGQFLKMNGEYVYGQAAVDPETGANLPWLANQTIKDYQNGGITSLTTDGTYIYGTSFAFGTGGTFEGPFALNPADGSIVWLADCLGDTYGVAPLDGAVYTVGHAHNCTSVGSFPDTSPRKRWMRAVAFSVAPNGTNIGPNAYGWNYNGVPKPDTLHWWPSLAIGNYTGQSQGAWSAASGAGYVALAGEFPNVNGILQQGLVRFGTPAVTTRNKVPQYQTVPSRTVTPPAAVAISPGTIRVSFQSAWDMDNEALTYQVFRNYGQAGQTLIATTTARTNFWQLPNQTASDRNVPPGTYTYTVRVSDPRGGAAVSATSDPVTTTEVQGAYPAMVVGDGANGYWRLGESSGTTAYDTAAAMDGTTFTGVTWGAAGALNGETGTAANFNGTSAGFVSAPQATAIPGPQTFSVEAWFKTNTTRGGKIIGFGNSRATTSTSNDRHIYMDNSGRLRFGVYPGSVRTIDTATTYNDNQWHHVVGTLDTTGMAFYVDGQLIGRDVTVTGAQTYNGFWRIGGDTLSGWPATPTNRNFTGVIDEVAVYPAALSPAQVAAHYTTSGRAVTPPPTATGAYAAAVLANSPSVYWRMNETTGPVARDYSGNTNNGVYTTTGVTYNVTGGVPGDAAARFNGSTGALASASNFPTSEVYSAEAWVRTTTTAGGKIFGWGNAQTGLSSAVDRSVSMTNAGKIRFSTGGAADLSIDSPASYNNGAWHHIVATQSDVAMNLYVDGELVASRSIPLVLGSPGFWRVGSDRVISGSTSSSFNGDIDEFAAYPTVLGVPTVKAHYRAGGGTVANTPPTGDLSVTMDGLDGTFSATGADADGTVTGFTWDLGDGTTSTATTLTHTYPTPGSYQVRLTVTDNDGATTTVTRTVVATNKAPVAAFTTSPLPMGVAVNGSGSSDPDGTITDWAWDFGDGSPVVHGATASHTYASGGTFDVTLTVTDTFGGTNSTTQQVTVEGTEAPTAAFTTDVTKLAVTVDGTTSSDPDGTIADWAWDFGDASPVVHGATRTHSYPAAGTYTITLTVTDNGGATATSTRQVVTVANVAPTAALSTSVTDYQVSVDAAGSADADGSVTGYAWDFGDGGTGTGATASHTYAVNGTYTVTVTVTDNDGSTATATAPVTINGPVLVDTFGRTTSNGWGSAEIGSTYTYLGNTANYSVNGGVGRMSVPGAGGGLGVRNDAPMSTATDLTLAYTSDKAPTGGGQYLSVYARGNSIDGYSAKIQATSVGAMNVSLVRTVAGVETTLSSRASGLTFTPGQRYTVRVQAFGTNPTTIQMKIWKEGDPEPATWLVSATDSTASLQVAGGVALKVYVSGTATNLPVLFSVDNLVARRL